MLEEAIKSRCKNFIESLKDGINTRVEKEVLNYQVVRNKEFVSLESLFQDQKF